MVGKEIRVKSDSFALSIQEEKNLEKELVQEMNQFKDDVKDMIK